MFGIKATKWSEFSKQSRKESGSQSLRDEGRGGKRKRRSANGAHKVEKSKMSRCSNTSSEVCETNRCQQGVRSSPVFDKRDRQQRGRNPSIVCADVLGIQLSTRKVSFAVVYTLCLWARLEAANTGKAWDQEPHNAQGDLNTSWGLKDSHGSGLESLPSRIPLGYIFILWRKCIFLPLNKASSWYKQVLLLIYFVCVYVCVSRGSGPKDTDQNTRLRGGCLKHRSLGLSTRTHTCETLRVRPRLRKTWVYFHKRKFVRSQEDLWTRCCWNTVIIHWSVHQSWRTAISAHTKWHEKKWVWISWMRQRQLNFSNKPFS